MLNLPSQVYKERSFFKNSLSSIRRLRLDSKDNKMIHLTLPCRMMIAGPSGCGKSTFVSELILNRNHIFSQQLDRIIYCAKFKTSIPESLREESIITFHEGCPSEEMLENSDGFNVFFIIDDLLESAFSSTIISQLFTQGRNRGISTCLLTQNLFPQYPRARNISLNCNFLTLFRNHRDDSSIYNLSRQVKPLNSRGFSDLFLSSVNKPYSYLFLDFSPCIPDALRFRQDIFSENPSIFATDDDIQKLKGDQAQDYVVEVSNI